MREHRKPADRIARPLPGRTIPIKLDSIFVRIAQIKRLAHAVIRGAIERDSRGDQAPQRIRQRGAGRIKNRDVKQSRAAGRRRQAAFALPRVQADMMVVAARREECRLRSVTLGDLEAQHIAIEAERAIEVGDFEMHVADGYARIDGVCAHAGSIHRFTMRRNPACQHLRALLY